jgi:outer membrane protein assembly factor BamA
MRRPCASWHGLCYCTVRMRFVRSLFVLLVLIAAVIGTACREEGDVRIASLDFNGVEQVDKGALTSALQTRKGSRLPWGRKRFFDRSAFEADLKRIGAFYRDRGFPDARVASFDVQLSDTQEEVAITVNISEGEPVLVEAIELTGFVVLSDGDQQALQDLLPLRVGRPLDRQVALAARERALNELRDNGYPYASVTVTDYEAGPRRRRVVFDAVPGTLAHFGPIEINGQVSVSENVIRRQLTFAPGDAFTRREMRESQRKLYGLELFEFVNIESREEGRRRRRMCLCG